MNVPHKCFQIIVIIIITIIAMKNNNDNNNKIYSRYYFDVTLEREY